MSYTRLLEHARRHLVPVDDALFRAESPLRALVGDATLVSLGEGLHGAAEPLDFRNRLAGWLARTGGVDVALESALSSGLELDDHVQGLTGTPHDAAAVAARGITSGLGRFEQQAALLAWARARNAAAEAAERVHVHGIDTSAFPAEPGSALQQALAYVERVDAPRAAALRERLQPAWPLLTIDRRAPEPAHYALVAPPARDAVTAAIADLLQAIEVHEAAWITQTSAGDHDRAWLAALGARQADLYLRQYPPGWSAAAGLATMMPAVAASDRAKADNVDLFLARARRAGERRRLLVFSHPGHAASAPVTITVDGAPTPLPPLMGTYLRRRHGARMVVIGHLYAVDRCHPGRAPAAPDALEAALASLDVPAFLLDLRGAPPAVHDELRPPHALYGQLPVHALSLSEGVDVLLYTEAATPAVRLGVEASAERPVRKAAG
jgi:erythromycin esterase